MNINYVGQANEFEKFFKLHDALIGNMHVFLNGVMIGCTNGDTTFEATQSNQDIVCTQKGESPSDQIISGADFKLTVPATGYELSRLAQVSPLVEFNMNLGRFVFTKGIGKSLKDSYPVHTIIAMADDAGNPDFSEPYMVFPYGWVSSGLQMVGNNSQRTQNLEITFDTVKLGQYYIDYPHLRDLSMVGFTSHDVEGALELPKELIEGPIAPLGVFFNEQGIIIQYEEGHKAKVIPGKKFLLQVDGEKHLVSTDQAVYAQNYIVLIPFDDVEVTPASEVGILINSGTLYVDDRIAAPLPGLRCTYRALDDFPEVED